MKYLHRDKLRNLYSEYANSQSELKEPHHEVSFVGNRDDLIIIDPSTQLERIVRENIRPKTEKVYEKDKYGTNIFIDDEKDDFFEYPKIFHLVSKKNEGTLKLPEVIINKISDYFPNNEVFVTENKRTKAIKQMLDPNSKEFPKGYLTQKLDDLDVEGRKNAKTVGQKRELLLNHYGSEGVSKYDRIRDRVDNFIYK